MAKVRVPKEERPPALTFKWADESWHVKPGTFRCKAYRKPRLGENYWANQSDAVYECFFDEHPYKKVILERVR